MFTSGAQLRCIIGYDIGEGQGPRTVGLMLKGFLVRNVLVKLYGYEVKLIFMKLALQDNSWYMFCIPIQLISLGNVIIQKK